MIEATARRVSVECTSGTETEGAGRDFDPEAVGPATLLDPPVLPVRLDLLQSHADLASGIPVSCAIQGGTPIAIGSAQFTLLRPGRDDPDRMDYAGDVPEDRQQDVEPEMQTQADREQNPHRRQEDRQNHADDVQ
jgi:hypothetical protein